MSPLEALVVFLLMALPSWWLVRREFGKREDPRYLREHGVIIVSEAALQGDSEPIGAYMGRPTWATVRFIGMDYRFDHVVDRRARERVAPRELFLDPGLVYLAV
jgi:hypothetical protein